MQVRISRETHDKLRLAQNLLRHSVPDGDVAVILDRALTVLLDKLEKQKCGSGKTHVKRKTPMKAPRRPRADRSRHVPASVRREVWAHDGGHCAFVGSDGRCPERNWLEFHHVVPYAGGVTNASNLQLRCRAHNQYEAELTFGPSRLRESSIGYSTVIGVQTQFRTQRVL